MTITEKYLQKILPYLAIAEGAEVRSKTIKGLNAYEFPCPFCCYKHKKEWKRKKRVGMFFYEKNTFSYRFNCLRCGEKMLFPEFLQKFDSRLFNKYQMERFHAGTTGKGHTLEHPKFKINKPKFQK